MRFKKTFAIFTCTSFLSLPLLAADKDKDKDKDMGKNTFETKCMLCHKLGKEGTGTIGPNLAGVVKRLSKEKGMKWVKDFILHPDKYKNDPEVVKTRDSLPIKMDMSPVKLTDKELDSVVAYLMKN